MNNDIKEKLKELSFQMMLNEASKLQIENSYSFSVMNNNKASIYSNIKAVKRDLLEHDKKGYELSLEFNDILLQNGKKFNNFTDGPDATGIWVENLLYKYNLSYPISWHVEYEDHNGLHFGYDKSDKINQNHARFVSEIEKLTIPDFEKERLLAAAEYYKARRMLLSKYHNNEIIEEETKGHTR